MAEGERISHQLGEMLPVWEWRRVLALAKEHDIACGGHYRAQFDAISFWAGPDDLPDDPEWARVEFDCGSLGYPRAHVGVIFRDPPEIPSSVDRATRVLQSIAANETSVGPQGAEVTSVEGQVQLRWVMRPFRKAEGIIGDTFLGTTIHQGTKVTVEDLATEADLAWCREKLEQLRKLIEG